MLTCHEGSTATSLTGDSDDTSSDMSSSPAPGKSRDTGKEVPGSKLLKTYQEGWGWGLPRGWWASLHQREARSALPRHRPSLQLPLQGLGN